MALDQVELEQQRLDLGGGDGHLDARDLPDEHLRLFPVRAAVEIARNAVLKVPRLAYVEDRAVSPEHAVDARLGRQRREKGAQVERRFGVGCGCVGHAESVDGK